MKKQDISLMIETGKTSLGIELGSTRIKGVLIDNVGNCLASGGHTWENSQENGIWTYSLEDIWAGVQDCFKSLAEDVEKQYNVSLKTTGAIGFSAMMHGYMAFDRDGKLLTPFRTWRNTITGAAAAELTELFSFNIPQRWSIAHLYQAILNGEEHVGDVAFLTTLAGYIHWQVTGEKVLGIGDASGMLPIDSERLCFSESIIKQFDNHIISKKYPWKLTELLPKVLEAGQTAGYLTERGAKLLDPSGKLQSGIPLCPPEGDAGTGMVATNSVAKRTGNVSAGTSVFLMAVLEEPLSKVYPEIDMVTTPVGAPVAMVHCNNCTNEINAWADIFKQAATIMGVEFKTGKLLDALFDCAMDGDSDCGGLVGYNYLSGEPVTGFERGCPLFVRSADSNFTLSNFMRNLLYSSVATLKIGMDILAEENIQLETLMGHGGFFKAPQVGQRVMAAAVNVPVSVMKTAGEGGPWGMALLASYMAKREDGETLEHYLAEKIFSQAPCDRQEPEKDMMIGFESFMIKYKAALAVERTAVDVL